MGKQRLDSESPVHLNSAGYTVIILGVLVLVATIAAFTSTFAWLQGRDQIVQVKNIAQGTRNLLDERVKQNEAATEERARADAELARRQEAAAKLVEDVIRSIQLNTAVSVDCIYLRDHGSRPAPCKEVNARIDRLQVGLPITVSTTTTRPPSTSTTTSTPSTIRPQSTSPAVSTSPSCRGISILGFCIGG